MLPLLNKFSCIPHHWDIQSEKNTYKQNHGKAREINFINYLSAGCSINNPGALCISTLDQDFLKLQKNIALYFKTYIWLLINKNIKNLQP